MSALTSGIDYPAHAGIRDVMLSRVMLEDDMRRPRLSVGGRGVRSSSAFQHVPVVAVAVLEDGVLCEAELFSALDLLESASGAFRVVIFSDSPMVAAARARGWTVEHIMPEMPWTALNPADSWMDAVSQRIQWVAATYGTSHFALVTSRDDAIDEIERLAVRFRIARPVVDGALEKFSTGPELTEYAEHRGWRGWLSHVPMGESSHQVRSDSSLAPVRVDLYRGARASVLVALRAGDVVGPLVESARAAGWSTAMLGDGGDGGGAGVRPVLEALGSRGVKILFGDERSVKPRLRQEDFLDGVAWADDSGDMRLLMRYDRVLESARVLDSRNLARLDEVRRFSHMIAR